MARFAVLLCLVVAAAAVHIKKHAEEVPAIHAVMKNLAGDKDQISAQDFKDYYLKTVDAHKAELYSHFSEVMKVPCAERYAILKDKMWENMRATTEKQAQYIIENLDNDKDGKINTEHVETAAWESMHLICSPCSAGHDDLWSPESFKAAS